MRCARLLLTVTTCLAPGLAAQDAPLLVWQPPPLVRPRVGDLERAEIRADLSVDAEGRVTAVEIDTIDPPGVADEALREWFDREARRWRYAPARPKGVPIAAETRLVLRYTFSAETGDGAVVSPWLRSETATERRAETFQAAPDRQRAALTELVVKAEALLAPDHRRGVQGERVRLRADIPDDTSAGVLAQNVEATFATLDHLFGAAVPPQPWPLPLEVVVYRSRAQLFQLRQQVGAPSFAEGFFVAPGLVALHTEFSSVDELLSLLIHESTHAWYERFVQRPGTVAPEWLSEGFAEYLGNSDIRKGQLVPGRTQKRRYEIANGVPWRVETGQALTLEALRKAHRKGEGLSFSDLLRADRALFYGERAAQFYPSAWVMVHFLRHGEKGWESKFSELLLAIAEGWDPSAAVESIYGAPPAELEGRYRQYLLKL